VANPSVQLTQPLHEVIRQGHPWVFMDAVHQDTSLKPGTVVDLYSQDWEWVARGVWDPDSPIRFRSWTTNPDTPVNNTLLEQRIRQALKWRSFPSGVTTGFRVLNGEGDRIPGLVCDVYANVGVFRVDGVAAERWIGPAARLLKKQLNVEHIAIKRSQIYAGQNETAEWLEGGVEEVEFLENSIRYVCDPIQGQKTGFFLDQRANRVRLAEVSRGRRLLNLFGYTGGFSVAAAMSGAARTTTVDLAKPAIATAERHFKMNGLVPQAHEFIASDVFAYLEGFQPGRAPFDVVVCDPPSFAHRRADLERATDAYTRLFARVFEIMPTGSQVALASCSSHVSNAIFRQIATQAAMQAGVSYVLQGVWGADIDHPTLTCFPEGDYLQFSMGSIYRD